MKKHSTTVILVESALMIALSTVLGMIRLFDMPYGGSVTCASMVPIVLLSFRYGPKWGVLAAFAESLLQMLVGGISEPVAPSIWAYFLVVILDYVLAFTAIGAASIFGKPFKNRKVSVAVGAAVVSLIRFLCSFVSGIVNWGAYAPEGWPVWLYSLTYNGGYMLPEGIITAVVSVLLISVLDRMDRPAVHSA